MLRGREGGEMAQREVGRAHHGQGNLLEGRQQEFGSGMPGGAGGIARIEAGQRPLLLVQARTGGIVERGEDAQGDGQEADQAGDMVVALQVEGREREGAPFEAAEAALDQVLLTIGQHSLGRREGGGGGVGGVDTPAQAAHGRRQRLGVHGGVDLEGACLAHAGGTVRVRAHGVFLDVLSDGHLDQAPHVITS